MKTIKEIISRMQMGRDQLRRWLGMKIFDKNNRQLGFPEKIERIVFIRWDGKWGDAIVSSFVFPALRSKFPHVDIQVVTTPNMLELFERDYQLDKVHAIEKRPKYNTLKNLAKVLGDVDVVVHMSPYLKMKDIYFLNQLNANYVVGLDDEINLINIKLGDKSNGKHFSERFGLILDALNVPFDDMQYRVPLRSESIRKVSDFLKKNKIENFIAFNPFGNAHARKMSPETVQKFVDEILADSPEQAIVLLHSPESAEIVKEVCASNPDKPIFYLQTMSSIFDAIALVNAAKAVISVDTAIVHIASGLNKPLLAIYNPDPVNFAAWHPNHADALTLTSDESEVPNINLLADSKIHQSIVDLKKLMNRFV